MVLLELPEVEKFNLSSGFKLDVTLSLPLPSSHLCPGFISPCNTQPALGRQSSCHFSLAGASLLRHHSR